jgi:hypothetical protein
MIGVSLTAERHPPQRLPFSHLNCSSVPADFESRFDIDYDGKLPESVDEASLKRMETVAYVLDE